MNSPLLLPRGMAPQRIAWVGGVSLLTLFLALAVAQFAVIETSVVLGSVLGLAVGLWAPVGALMAWLVSGPTLGSWVSFRIGPLPALTPDRAIFVILFLITAVRVMVRSRPMPRLGLVAWCMLLFSLFALGSTFVRGGTWRTIEEGGIKSDLIFLIQGYMIPFLGFVLARALIVRERHASWLLYTLIAVSTVAGAVGILEYFTGIKVFNPTRFESIHENRATGSFATAVEFGMIMDAGLIAATLMLLRTRTLLGRSTLAAVIGLGLVAVVFSKTRSVWLALAVGLTVLALGERRLRRPMAMVAVFALLALLLSLPILLQTQFAQGRVFAIEPIYNRVALTATALDMAAEHPLLGAGFGRFTFLEDKWQHISSMGDIPPYYAYQLSHPHNSWLHILVLLGLVGFVLFALVIAMVGRGAWRLRRLTTGQPGPVRDLALASLAVFAVYLVVSLFTELMFYAQAGVQVFVLLGAAHSLADRMSPEHCQGRRHDSDG